MRKNTTLAILMASAAAALVLGCSRTNDTKNNINVQNTEAETVETAEASVPETTAPETDVSETETEPAQETDTIEETNEETGESPETVKDTELSYYQKAAFLTDSLYEQNKDNVSISMLSLDMALALANAGADSSTKTVLDNYLGKEDSTKWAEDYLKYVKKYPYKENSKLILELSNGIWIDDDYEMTETYKSDSEKFDAVASTIDVQDMTNRADAVYDINKYVEEKTHGLIPEIVNASTVTADTATVLVNTLYFKGKWNKDWDQATGKFTVTDESGDKNVLDCKMISQELKTYFENDKAIGFAANYSGGIQFIGILPKEEGDFTIKNLDIDSFLESKDTSKTVYAKMPVVKFDTTNECIVNSLKAMGFTAPFDPSSADFSKMCILKPGYNLYISDIIQKTTMDINKNGTEASAATAVTMAVSCAMAGENDEVYVTLDRPYAFMIYDSENDEILFMGKVVNPRK